MDCKRYIKTQECSPEMSGEVSHGLCKKCRDERIKEMNKTKKENKNGQ